MSSPQPDDQQRIMEMADPDAVAQLDARATSKYAFHFVLIGISSIVAAVLLFSLGFWWGLLFGLIVIGAATGALGTFVAGHYSTAMRHMHRARAFWTVFALTWLATYLVTAMSPQQEWVIWAGGSIGLLDGLVIGQLVNKARSATSKPDGSAAH